MSPEALTSPAWLLIGLTRSTPGVLSMLDGKLSFTTENGQLFNAALAELHTCGFHGTTSEEA